MQSKKAKEFIENISFIDFDQTKSVSSGAAIKSVELAEQEILEKAVEAFCKSINCPLLNEYECMSETPCEKMQDFINQLN